MSALLVPAPVTHLHRGFQPALLYVCPAGSSPCHPSAPWLSASPAICLPCWFQPCHPSAPWLSASPAICLPCWFQPLSPICTVAFSQPRYMSALWFQPDLRTPLRPGDTSRLCGAALPFHPLPGIHLPFHVCLLRLVWIVTKAPAMREALCALWSECGIWVLYPSTHCNGLYLDVGIAQDIVCFWRRCIHAVFYPSLTNYIPLGTRGNIVAYQKHTHIKGYWGCLDFWSDIFWFIFIF